MSYRKIAVRKFVEAQIEGEAGATITPGMLLEETSTGELQAHSTAGGDVQPIIAKEEGYVGGTVDDDYSAGDQVRAELGYNGERFYAWLAAGESVTKEDLLESAGDGTFQAYTNQVVDEGGAATYTLYPNAARFKTVETIDNSAGAEKVRIKVEVVK